MGLTIIIILTFACCYALHRSKTSRLTTSESWRKTGRDLKSLMREQVGILFASAVYSYSWDTIMNVCIQHMLNTWLLFPSLLIVALKNSAYLFQRTATSHANRMWWKNVKLWIILIVIAMIILAVITGQLNDVVYSFIAI